MTTISRLPEEILFAIFENFKHDLESLTECQYVCRAWYRAAHLKILKDITLHEPLGIEQFIASIDSNPNAEYLKAVKKMWVFNFVEDAAPYRLSRENAIKLFFRFPNLKEVHIDGDLLLFDNFDDELCKAFWKACPKVKSFEADTDYRYMEITTRYDMLYKIRYLVTKLLIDDINEAQRFGTVQDFITSFPRLKDFGDLTGNIDSFQALLPSFEKLPDLQRLTICVNGNDDIIYTDKYLETYQSITRTLSNITHLDLLACRGISADSFDFIKKYLNGLGVVTINSRTPTPWTDLQQILFCSNTLDLLPFVKTFTDFHLWIDTDALRSCLPSIVQKVFRQVPPPYTNKAKRVLNIELASMYMQPPDMATLKLEVRNLSKKIRIAFNDKIGLDEIEETLSESEPIQDVDKFILKIKNRGELDGYYCEATMEMYNNILRRMPSLKEVSLDIPLSFVETELLPPVYEALPRVEDVTLQAGADTKFQTLLDGFFYSFPNIKRLNLYYFCGIWNEDIGEFHLDLRRYELETLDLDVTAVRRKMKNTVDKERFLLSVEFISNSRQYMYLVSTKDLSFSRMTDMNALNGFVRGKDYYRVNIKINNLQELKLCMNDNPYDDDKEEYAFSCTRVMHQATIFNEDDNENKFLNKNRDTALLY